MGRVFRVDAAMRHLTLRHGLAPLVCALALVAPARTHAQTSPKLDPLLQARAAQLSGRSRVIVQFRGTPDARVLTRSGGVAGPELAAGRAQVADVSNLRLTELAGDPNVTRVVPDRETFATMERTGNAI